MKICATCQKPLADQIEICQHCHMKVLPYAFEEDVELHYRDFPRWMIFPPIPKTHWWGTELDKGPASKSETNVCASNGPGMFAIVPVNPPLDLGIGRYKFCCFLSINRIPVVRGKSVGFIRVLSDGKEVAKEQLESADFDNIHREASINVEFMLNEIGKKIQCEFNSGNISNISINLIWLRLVPVYGWRWDKWDKKSLYYHGNTSIIKEAVTLDAVQGDQGDGKIQLYGPYMYLPSGFYKLTALVSVETETEAFWDITANRSRRKLYKLPLLQSDSLLPGKPGIMSGTFYLDSDQYEVEFRIRVKQGQVTVYWLHLVTSDGLIWEKYYELGGKDSILGLPLSAEGNAIPSVRGVEGRYRRFEGGTIYFNSENFEAWEVWGAISSLFKKERFKETHLGFPIESVQSITSSFGTIGEVQLFRGWGKTAIFAYPEDRTHVCAVYGNISGEYWREGGPTGPLGFPTSEGEYKYSEGNETFQRSDFEGGYITYREGKTEVHHYPRPHIEVTYHPKRISRGKDIVITVTGTLEGGPFNGAWCTLSFPDQIEHLDSEPIKVEGGNEDPQSQVALWGSLSSSGYGTASCKLQYPRVEMSRWKEDWPSAPDNSFEVTVRPAKAGIFRIFARFTSQDDEDLVFYGTDPDRRWLNAARMGQVDANYLGRDLNRHLDVVKDQQSEAVYVYEVQVDEPGQLTTLPAVADFDVFLCYNSEDREEVKKIGVQLKEQRILPWLDEWELRPGLPWQQLLEQQIEKIKSVAVFVGKNAIGPWQQRELDAFLREFVNRGCPVIPVLLQDAPRKPPLPIFLSGMTWVDFRRQDPDPIERLVWGITGEHQ